MNTAPVRPSVVTAAFWIWLLAALSGMVSVVTMLVAVNVLATLGSIAAEEPEAYLFVTGFGLIVAWIAIAMVVFQVILSVLYRDGRNWSRITLAVFAVLSIATVVMDVTSLFAWVYVAANLIALVLSFLPEANTYFATAGTRRRTAAPVEAATA
ncbi:hypothetical protein [Microbacterium sp. GXF7504]